ncbi:5-amino-6-(5-phospho-D-ribitylamino)uracil phosphatase YcsE [bioreactor metagenome]|uniref:5-amino-6-(5-phospho-D-ribitylamino)uracil phosphatase YcsE n=1 Tax=bioreactor metagenome TaxID=1076179 RepID=A0A645ENS5_9ZZZZ
MEKIKMLVFDIDGTLIPRGSTEIEPSAKEAINICREKGLKVLVATGRCYYFIQPDVINHFNSDYYVTINGQCLINKDKKIVKKYTLQEAYMQRMTDLCVKHNVAIGYKFDTAIVTYNDYPHYLETYVGGIPHPDILFDGDQTKDYHLKNGLPMGGFLIGDEANLDQVQQGMPELDWVVAYPRAREAFSHGINKSSTIEYVLHELGLTWDNVMSFGDADNDVEMISKAKIGVALGNGSASAKNHADYVTTDCGDNGIYNALKHFDLI